MKIDDQNKVNEYYFVFDDFREFKKKNFNLILFFFYYIRIIMATSENYMSEWPKLVWVGEKVKVNIFVSQ